MIMIFGTLVRNDDIFKLFSFFQNFDFVGCVSGVKEQKKVQNEKKFCHAPYLRNYTSYNFH